MKTGAALQDDRAIRYIRRNLDEASIVAALVAVAASDTPADLGEQEQMVMAALRRANHSLAEASPDEIANYLAKLDESQVPGLVSNVKGILHEMEFAHLENEDGDSVYVSLFEDSNHPGMDVMFIDESTGETWEAQLKATDNVGYVQDWIDNHPEGEILVTEELAEKMGLPGSGQSNEELTTRVEGFVDQMIAADESAGIWDFFPALSVISISVIVFELWRRYRSGHISSKQFQHYAVLATGLKASKIAGIMFLLTVPVVGQVTGALLIAKLLLSAKRTWFENPPTWVPPKALPAQTSVGG